MALYRLSVGVIARGRTGRLTARSAVAAAAYQAREELQDEARQQPLDFSSVAEDLVMSEILLPKLAPYRWFDREVLWNEVEASERRADARLARSVVLTLPRELDVVAGTDLAREFFLDAFVKRGMVADMAVHLAVSRDHEPQPHAHALLTTRRIVDGAFGLKERAWNSVALLREWRQEWADLANKRLAERGTSAKLDHRRWFLWKAPEMQPQRDPDTHPIKDAVRIAGALGIIGAAVTTQAMRDIARRFVTRERRADVPLDTAAPKAPIDTLRDELRQPLRAAAVGVAAGAWTYREALDRLVGNHLVPAARRYPELDARFEDLEEKLGNALAKRTGRVQAQIEGNAALLRKRAERLESPMTTQATKEDIPMAERVPGAGLTEAEKIEVGRQEERWRKIEATPEFKEMEASVQAMISAVSTGEASGFNYERDWSPRRTTQSDRDLARQSVPTRSPTHAASEAARRAQVAAERSNVLTAG